jgi:hypothetical protein
MRIRTALVQADAGERAGDGLREHRDSPILAPRTVLFGRTSLVWLVELLAAVHIEQLPPSFPSKDGSHERSLPALAHIVAPLNAGAFRRGSRATRRAGRARLCGAIRRRELPPHGTNGQI